MIQTAAQPVILFVDDEPNILRTLQRLMMDEGYEIVTATSGDAALQLLRDGLRPAVVISDQRMSGMSGVEFLAEVRRLKPDCIRMILTGYADIDAVVDAINLGEVYRYILKPWENDDLKHAIAAAVERHRLLGENAKLTRELEMLNAELEKKVEERTAALRRALAANLQLTEALKEKVRELEAWERLQTHLQSIHPRRQTLALLRELIGMVTATAWVRIWLVADDGVLSLQSPDPTGDLPEELSVRLSAHRQKVFLEQKGEVLAGEALPLSLKDEVAWIAVVPMCRKDQCEGVVEIASREDKYSERTLHTLQNFLNQGAIALNDARVEKELPLLEESLDVLLANLNR